MIPQYLLDYPWIATGIWFVLYIGDYYLTLWGERLFKAQDVFVLEGSYELNPLFVKDVDRQRKMSPKHIANLVISTSLLWLVGTFSHDMPIYYAMFVGYMLFMEAAVHLRHFTNICFYRKILSGRGYSGQIRVSRETSYSQSAVQLFWMAVLFLFSFGITYSYPLLGGAFGIMALGSSHWRLAKKEAKKKAAASPSQGE